MKRLNFFAVVGLVSLVCQGCASPPATEGMWQGGNAKLMDLGNGICRQSNGLMWQVERTEVFASGHEAEAYVQNLSLGNHADWRLPSRDELYDLCNIFEMNFAGDCALKPKGSYWSKNGDTEAGEWQAYPLCGGSEFQYLKGKSGRVRAVRP
jgi:hypothetical protein